MIDLVRDDREMLLEERNEDRIEQAGGHIRFRNMMRHGASLSKSKSC